MKSQIIGGFEEIVEQGGQAVKQNAKAFLGTAKGQVSGDQGTNEQGAKNQSQMSDDQAKQFLSNLYGKTSDQEGVQESPKGKGKTPEELAKIESLRKQLHGNYYESLTAKPKEEIRAAEKVEREKANERWELEQKKADKPPALPPTVKLGTGEKMVGVAG